MSEQTDTAQPNDDSVVGNASRSGHQSSRLHQALAWVGVVAGGLFIVAGIFFAGFFLNWSEHTAMGNMSMGHASAKDCCADMKPGEHMQPGAMTGSRR